MHHGELSMEPEQWVKEVLEHLEKDRVKFIRHSHKPKFIDSPPIVKPQEGDLVRQEGFEGTLTKVHQGLTYGQGFSTPYAVWVIVKDSEIRELNMDKELTLVHDAITARIHEDLFYG